MRPSIMTAFFYACVAIRLPFSLHYHIIGLLCLASEMYVAPSRPPPKNPRRWIPIPLTSLFVLHGATPLGRFQNYLKMTLIAIFSWFNWPIWKNPLLIKAKRVVAFQDPLFCMKWSWNCIPVDWGKSTMGNLSSRKTHVWCANYKSSGFEKSCCIPIDWKKLPTET